MNATASVVLGAARHSGRAMSAAVSAFDGMALYGDGASLYGYLGGSPQGRRDELGLRFGADLLGEAVLFGVRGLRGGLEGMLSQYSANMENDLDWAMDWSQGDDWHSRRNNDWVQETFNQGMMQGFREAFDDLSYGVFDASGGDDHGPAMASQWKPFVKNTVRAVGRTHGGVNHMKKMREVTVKLIKDLKFSGTKFDIRHNQALIDPMGRVLGIIRPDVQLLDRANKKLYIREVWDTSRSAADRRDAIRAAMKRSPNFSGWSIDYSEVRAP